MRVCSECGARLGDELARCPDDDAPALRVDHPCDLTGQRFDGRFLILEPIGQGGMATVYRAFQPSRNREVALKVLKSDLSRDPKEVRRFFREARTLSRLASPRVVAVLDFGQAVDGRPWVALELLSGSTLHAEIHRCGGRLPLERALRIVVSVLQSLEETHGAGIAHRDIKPENVFLLAGTDDDIKILDYGLAQVIAGKDAARGDAVTTRGTPVYMSPEQAFGRAVDGRTDLYAVGVMLFEMLAGRPPFDDESSVTILMRKGASPAPALRDVAPQLDVPPGIEALISGLLETDPTARPATAAKTRQRLLELADAAGLSLEARQPPGGSPDPVEPLPGTPGPRDLGSLATALALEEEGARFYQVAASKCTSPAARELFEVLASQEEVHAASFREIFARLEGCETSWADLELPQDSADQVGLAELFERLLPLQETAVREDDGLREALAVGLAFERRVVEFWERRVAAASDPAERKFARAILLEEREHVGSLTQIHADAFGTR